MAATANRIEAGAIPAPERPLLPPVWEDPGEAGPPGTPGMFLVGTVHGDPRGHVRVRRLLEEVRPQAVTVEISPFSVRYRGRHELRWRRLLRQALAALPPAVGRHLAVRRLAAAVRLPYEWQAAAAFGRRHGAVVVAVDSSAPARRHLPAYAGELLSPENLRALATLPDGSLAAWVSGEYRRARHSARRPLVWPTGEGLQEIRQREEAMARRLRRLWRRFPRLVHLGGWEHLAPREPQGNLFDRLADLAPRRWLLEEVELWPPRPA